MVVTYNRLALLRESIEALRSQTYQLHKILVVNNGSSDGTESYLKSQDDLIVLNQMNLGCSGGQAAGILEAMKHSPDWLWLMDDDAIPEINALQVLMESSRVKERDVGALVCSIWGVAGDQSTECAIRCSNLFRGSRLKESDFLESEVQVWAYPLLGILVRSEAVSKVGGVDPRFFIYSDDLDFTLRISDAYKIFVITDSRIVHKCQAVNFKKITFGSFAVHVYPISGHWKEYYTWRNYLHVLRRRLGILAALGFLMSNIRTLLKNVVIADRRWKRLCIYAQAISDGWCGELGKKIDPKVYSENI